MEESESSQSLAQAADQGRELLERHWRSVIEDQYKRAEDKLLAFIDTGMEKAAERMAELATLVATQCQLLSPGLCPDVPIGEHLNKRLGQAAAAHLRTKYQHSMQPAVREVATRPVSPPVRAIAPPVRAVESRMDVDGPENAADSIGMVPNRGRASRTPSNDPSEPRTPHRSNHTRDVYDPPTSEPANDVASANIRTILTHDVEEVDYIFPYPELGPGHFIIRCDSGDISTHSFEFPPLEMNRAGRHFVQRNPKGRCHREEDAVFITKNDAMIRRFGYRVLDSDGNNVDDAWVARSNKKLAQKVERRKRAKARAKARNKPRKPPKARFGRTARRGISPRAAAMFSELSTTTATANRGAAPLAAVAGPSNPNRGAAPMAEMDVDPAGLWGTQAPEREAVAPEESDWGSREEGEISDTDMDVPPRSPPSWNMNPGQAVFRRRDSRSSTMS
ncbi:hypothetical protein C8A05DRAFT_38801 [Staphylotrichum tortipilum]|uniref:Uncharacterized protein n=1 Tax=Staphylotrichum tortipilum TaxID=2831512 RepID=A0AAN6RNY2_9PEZI|nr:hypothetical protein C8A05DRAFT_38801 [Staphylotrichum longicolle]